MTQALDPQGKLENVHPRLAEKVRAMAADLAAVGITITVTSGMRSVSDQDDLYAQGRSFPGTIVTNARGGQSMHNYGLAVDVDTPNEGNFARIGVQGQAYGLVWGGSWSSLYDPVHFEMPRGGRNMDQLLAMYDSGGLDEVFSELGLEAATLKEAGGSSVWVMALVVGVVGWLIWRRR